VFFVVRIFEITQLRRNVPSLSLLRFDVHLLFGSFGFRTLNLSFDLVQDGELVEPFDIWDLVLGI